MIVLWIILGIAFFPILLGIIMMAFQTVYDVGHFVFVNREEVVKPKKKDK